MIKTIEAIKTPKYRVIGQNAPAYSEVLNAHSADNKIFCCYYGMLQRAMPWWFWALRHRLTNRFPQLFAAICGGKSQAPNSILCKGTLKRSFVAHFLAYRRSPDLNGCDKQGHEAMKK